MDRNYVESCRLVVSWVKGKKPIARLGCSTFRWHIVLLYSCGHLSIYMFVCLFHWKSEWPSFWQHVLLSMTAHVNRRATMFLHLNVQFVVICIGRSDT